MAAHTTFGIGGPADMFIRVGSPSELGRILAFLETEGIPGFILGGGANILVGDRGIRGIVLDLSGLSWARNSGEGLWAGAGISVDRLCEHALAFERDGLENFYGMPGSLGGALYMNARCYEKDFSELVESISIASPGGRISTVRPPTGQWAYKKSPFQPGGALEGSIIVGATLGLGSGRAEEIAGVMRARKSDRTAKGHYRLPSAGSVFKNDRSFGKPTGLILDSLGLKGTRIGDALVSTWHANIFVNAGKAKAEDMKALIETAQERAYSVYGFRLEPEVLLVGEF